jgi:uncharacterized protein YjiS (DUF1127 family)
MAHVMNLNTYVAADRPGVFARLRETIANRVEYLKIRDELEALTDRELADIGVSRLDVRDVAHAAVYGC